MLLGASAASGATTGWKLTPSSVDFGPVRADGASPVAHEFLLENTGETAIDLYRLGTTWRETAPVDPYLFMASRGDCHRVLGAGESCSFPVSFTPSSAGPKRGELIVTAEHGEVPAVTTGLVGEGVLPLAETTPEQLDFASTEVGTSSLPQAITIENRGSISLVIEGLSFTDAFGVPQPSSSFQVFGGTCQSGVAVEPGGSCTVGVVFKPREPGVAQYRLAIADDAPGSPQAVEVQGIGVEPPSTGGWSGPGVSTRFIPETTAPPPPATQPTPQPRVRVHITHRPVRVSRRRAATFWFAAAPAEAGDECEIDRRGYKPCSAPRRYRGLAVGRHVFKVRARDSSGGPASRPARFHWRIKSRRR